MMFLSVTLVVATIFFKPFPCPQVWGMATFLPVTKFFRHRLFWLFQMVSIWIVADYVESNAFLPVVHCLDDFIAAMNESPR